MGTGVDIGGILWELARLQDELMALKMYHEEATGPEHQVAGPRNKAEVVIGSCFEIGTCPVCDMGLG